jgi:hypothetical protein
MPHPLTPVLPFFIAVELGLSNRTFTFDRNAPNNIQGGDQSDTKPSRSRQNRLPLPPKEIFPGRNTTFLMLAIIVLNGGISQT